MESVKKNKLIDKAVVLKKSFDKKCQKSCNMCKKKQQKNEF